MPPDARAGAAHPCLLDACRQSVNHVHGGPLEWLAMKLAFRAAPTAEAARARDALEAALRPPHARGRRGHRAPGRRRVHAGDAARPSGAGQADLRHEPGHGRLPAQQLRSGRRLLARIERAQRVDALPLADADASCATAASSRPSASTRSRSTARAARRPSCAIAIDDVVPPARAGLRRHPGGDAGRLDRLQPLRPRADHPARPPPSWR